VEAGHDLMTQPIGSGPYRLEPGGDALRLVRHDGGDHDAWIDALEFTTIPDDEDRAAALLAGRIDMDVLMGPEAWDDVVDSPAHRAIATGDGRWHWLMVNCADALLADAGVRRAIAVGLDRVALAEGSFGPHAAPLLGGVIAPWSWAAADGFTAFSPRGDRRLARTLLDVTGTAPGTPIRIAALERLPIGQRQAHLVAEQLQALGFAPSVHVLSAAEWAQTVTRGGPFQLATSYWGSPINDPDDFMYMGFRSGARYDTGTCGNEALDALLEAGRASFDQADRTELYRQLQIQMAEDLPVIPTIQPDVLRGVTTRLHGFVPLRNAQLRSLREAWLEP
jgi:peptide/nickel transport system substrate-binding protein